MEVLLVILILAIWIFGFGNVLKAGKVAAKTAIGEGSFKENVDDEFTRMGPLELRGRIERMGKEDHRFDALVLEVRGLFPVSNTTNMTFVTSVFDGTENTKFPAVSMVSSFQEPATSCFQDRRDVGELKPGWGFKKWAQVGFIPLEILQPARSGTRQMDAVVRLIDEVAVEQIKNGRVSQKGSAKCVWTKTHQFPLDFAFRGWLDEQTGDREVSKATVGLAVAVAMADGELHDEEGERIRGWIASKISAFDGHSRESWKNDLNQALRDAFELANSSGQVLSDYIDVLNEDASSAERLACVDLLFDIVAADEVVQSAELGVVNRIAESLGIDPEELKSISDQKLVSARAEIGSDEDLEEVLGIDPALDKKAIQAHLRQLFQKWNNRITSLEDPGEVQNAQQMLDLIAEARKKYR